MYEVTRRYKFYAAHRNESAGGKCARIHGHRYLVRVILSFEGTKDGITMLFDDINRICEPIIESLDHNFLVWEKDPLLPALNRAGEDIILLPFETSVENLARFFFDQIKKRGLPIKGIEIEETDSSIIRYEE